MPPPDSTSHLPKWPFLLGDVALLGAAGLIAADSPHPLSPEAAIAIVASVIVATIAGVIPFLADYARRQDEALDERQRALESLAHTVTAAAQQISIAVRGFQEITEQAERKAQPAAAPVERDPREEARRAAETGRFESAAEKIARAAVEWSRLELASQKHLAGAKQVLAELNATVASQSVAAAKAPDDPPPPPPVSASVVRPAPPPPAPKEAASAPAAPPPVAAADLPPSAVPATTEALPAAEAAAKPSRKRAPKKSASETAAPLPGPTLAELQPALELLPAVADEGPPAVVLAVDGATRLLVTAYIGIGNRLFIRGDGPGLSWERGVPLQFVSIGKWRWEAADASGPVNFKLYKNDELVCSALQSRPLEPGHQHEVTATF